MQLLVRLLKVFVVSILILVLDVLLWGAVAHFTRGASANAMFVLTCGVMWLHVIVMTILIQLRRNARGIVMDEARYSSLWETR